MASPTVAARTETALTSAGTSFTVNFTQTTGDLVVIFIALANGGTISPGDSFTNTTNTNSSFHIIHKVLDGTEGGNVVVTIPSSKAAALAYNIQSFSGSPEFSTVAAGSDTNPDPGDLTPAGGSQDYLWLAAFRNAGEEADDDTWCTAAPTNFTNLIQKTSGTGGSAASNTSIAGANFASTAASLDPATFTTTQSLSWLAYTVAISPVSGTLHTQSISGTSSDSGALQKNTLITKAGSSTNVGGIQKLVSISSTGASTNVGILSKLTNRILSGVASNAGDLQAVLVTIKTQFIDGASTNSGNVQKLIATLKEGSSTNLGLLQKTILVTKIGVSSSVGTLQKLTSRIIGGLSNAIGTLLASQIFSRVFTAASTSVGDFEGHIVVINPPSGNSSNRHGYWSRRRYR